MKAALSVALALLVTACSDSTGFVRDLRVQTDASVYNLGPGGPANGQATVHFTVKNTGSTTLNLANCGAGVSGDVQQLQGSQWVTVSGAFCPAFAVYAPISLAPGETTEGHATVTTAGRFRIRVTQLPAGDEEETQFAVSGIFQARWLEN